MVSGTGRQDSHWLEWKSSLVDCGRCSRLRTYCEAVAHEKKRAHLTETYWGKPVPPLGHWEARLAIVGLAPAAHGANRTGRMFTGDRSGLWLYRALHRFGFCNQAESTAAGDGLELIDTYITAAVKCAPPDNKPTPEEFGSCASYLQEELSQLRQAKVYLSLGKIAHDAVWPFLQERFRWKDRPKESRQKPKFAHGLVVELDPDHLYLCSYHPSQQNTFTGLLTEPMFDAVFERARKFIC